MFWNKRSFRTMGFTCLALLLFTATALAGQKDLGESGGSAACERMIHLSEEAEKQLPETWESDKYGIHWKYSIIAVPSNSVSDFEISKLDKSLSDFPYTSD